MTVARLRAEMPQREFRQWIAFYRSEYERERQGQTHAKACRRKGR